MKLQVKDVDISSGGPLIVMLNRKDAKLLDLHYGDRIRVRKKESETMAIIDVAQSDRFVSAGKIGLFEEVLKKIGARDRDFVEIFMEKKPASIEFIRNKLDGKELNKDQIYAIIKDIVDDRLSEIELAYFVAGCYTRDLSMQETIHMTNAIVETGKILKIDRYPLMDVHCIGGVPGNRTTLVIVPIIAAAGLYIPKTSTRAITSPSGTADTFEVMTKVSLTLQEIEDVVIKTHGCIVWGGAVDLAPADDKIIKIRHTLSIDPRGQLLASIIGKKKSVCATHILMDIPLGKGTKIQTYRDAQILRHQFLSLTRRLKMKCKVIVTDGKEPIGNGIGPALEARDVLWVLENDSRMPSDLKEKSIMMAGLMLRMAGKAKPWNANAMAREILESGKAYEKYMEIVEAQGGKRINSEQIKLSRNSLEIISYKDGVVKQIDNLAIAKIARIAGAPEEKESGLYLWKHVNSKVRTGDKLVTLYAENKEKLKFALEIYREMNPFVIE